MTVNKEESGNDAFSEPAPAIAPAKQEVKEPEVVEEDSIPEPKKRAPDKPAPTVAKPQAPAPETGEVSLDDLVSEWS